RLFVPEPHFWPMIATVCIPRSSSKAMLIYRRSTRSSVASLQCLVAAEMVQVGYWNRTAKRGRGADCAVHILAKMRLGGREKYALIRYTAFVFEADGVKLEASARQG